MSDIDILSNEYIDAANNELSSRECPLPDCHGLGTGSVSVSYDSMSDVLDGVIYVQRFLRYTCSECGRSARLETLT